MSSQNIPVIVIRRGGDDDGHGGHHGAAWKVAYADFVTAMMAFFLLLWLLNATSEEKKRGIADYFTPNFALSDQNSGAGGVLGGQTLTTPGAAASGSAPMSPLENMPSGSDSTVGGNPDSLETGNGDQPGRIGVPVGVIVTASNRPGVPSSGPTEEQGRGFAPLDEHTPPPALLSPIDVLRPPSPWVRIDQATTGSIQRTEAPVQPSAWTALSTPAPAPPAPEPVSAAPSVTPPVPATNVADAAGAASAASREAANFERAAKEIQTDIAGASGGRLLNNLVIDHTPEGLRIQLIDRDATEMFASGNANPSPHLQQMLRLVAKAILPLPNRIAIRGHTDSRPFAAGAGRDNWTLSAERANATRHILGSAGLTAERITQIAGLADTDPYVKEDPADPRNRRISLILLRAQQTANASRQP